MVTSKSVYPNELFRFVELFGTILAVGVIRLFRYIGQYDLGGFNGNGRWTHLLLFGGRFSQTARWNENTEDSAIFVRIVASNGCCCCLLSLSLMGKLISRFVSICRKKLFNEHMDDPNYVPLPEERERPGGFNWGGDAQQPNQRPEQQPPQQPAPNQ